MSFNDIFKSSFLENVSTVSVLDMLVALILAFCLGIPLAVIGSVIIGIILLVFVNKNSYTNPYIVVLQCDGGESEKR